MENLLSNFETLFSKIRINFLFNHPFLSVLALSLKTEFQRNKRSAFQTDGLTISIDLEKLKTYGEDEIIYLYAHTLLHIVLKHPSRRASRELELWNKACDFVINLILETFDNVGIMPKDEMYNKKYRDKSVEEVYEILLKEQEEKSNSNENKKETKSSAKESNFGDVQASKYNNSKQDIDEVANNLTNEGNMEKLDGIIIQALTIAQRSISKYTGLSIEIDEILKPEINLHDILKEYLISSFFEKNLTFSRPNRRFIHENLYLPGYKKSDEFIEIYIALDSSSSVSLEEYKKFLGIINEVCEGFYEYKIVILPFDKFVKIEYIMEFDSFNQVGTEAFFIPKSDGGTNFDEVLRYLKTTQISPNNLLMVLSDGEFDINESLVSQTLFIISDNKNLKKFEKYGRVIQFKI